MRFFEDSLSTIFFQAAHYRHKRSTDFTNVKSNKPAIATHDVATKPSLIDTKYSTAIDSLLPENKSIDTNGKYLTNSHQVICQVP